MASIFLNLDTQLINIYGLLAKGLGCWSIRPDFPDLIVRGISMAELVFDLSEVNDKHHRGLKYSFFTSMQHLRWRRYPTGKYNFRVINNRTILTHFSPIPTNARRVFHVETMWKRSFPPRFNVEYTWCVCRNVLFLYPLKTFGFLAFSGGLEMDH